MGVNAKIRHTQKPKALTVFDGAAPKTVTGNSVLMLDIMPGTMSANVYANAKTNNLTLTAKWQVSDDNSTFVDVKMPNNAANVVVVTGTGSDVADTICLVAPDAVYAKRYARVVVVSGVGVGDATDDAASVSYNWRLAD